MLPTKSFGVRTLNGGGATASRHPANLPLTQRVQRQARIDVYCMGRNDGASGKKRRGNGQSNCRQPQMSNPAEDVGLWYERGSEPETSGIEPGGTAVQSQRPATRPERGYAGDRNRGSSSTRQNKRNELDGDNDDDAKGWWERPEERSMQAYAPPTLEPWQAERLQHAYATGRRKVQIKELAQELDVDRSVVLAWFKEFALRPQEERDVILAARRSEAAVQRDKQVAAPHPAEAAGQDRRDANSASPAALPNAKSKQEAPSGNVPFYLRKQLGMDKRKRLSGEVLRTLEAVYDRTPFPSAEVIRGLFELHRLPKETALEWFAARREADGITSSTQKRAARPSQRERDRDVEGAFNGDKGYEEPASLSSNLLSQLGAAGGMQQAAKESTEPMVVSLSRREMAALRSSLPSPNKHKGRQMAEKMGIKTGPDTSTTQIGNVQFVQDSVQQGDRLRASWRYRGLSADSAGGLAASGRRLRLRKRGVGGAADSDGESSGSEE